MAASIDWWLDFDSSLLLDVLYNDSALLGNGSAASAAGGIWDEIAVTPSYWCPVFLSAGLGLGLGLGLDFDSRNGLA